MYSSLVIVFRCPSHARAIRDQALLEGVSVLVIAANPPPKCFVNLNQGEQFVTPGLGQAQLGTEQIAIRIQRIEQRVYTAPIPQISQA